jgi:hypothetical protein
MRTLLVAMPVTMFDRFDTFIEPAKTWGVVNVFDKKTLPMTSSVAPPWSGAPPIPTLDRATTVATLIRPVAIRPFEVMIGALIEFEDLRSPWTYAVVPDAPAVPKLKKPVEFTSAPVLSVPTFAVVA